MNFNNANVNNSIAMGVMIGVAFGSVLSLAMQALDAREICAQNLNQVANKTLRTSEFDNGYISGCFDMAKPAQSSYGAVNVISMIGGYGALLGLIHGVAKELLRVNGIEINIM